MRSSLALPSLPGVYWFLNAAKQVLYVGKAKDLKKRIQQYRQLNRLSREKQRLVQTATKVKFQELDSELEALLIEAELIRTHQPEFNILLKDDKSPLYLHLTKDEFPQVKLIRKKELSLTSHKGTVLGPFPSTYKLKEVLKIARKIFPWCEAPLQRGEVRRSPANGGAQAGDHPKLKPCFYYHINQCPGACIGKISAQDYQDNIKQLQLFLTGKTKAVVKELKLKLKQQSDLEHYEQAAILRDRLKLIEEVTSPKFRLQPDVTLPQLKATFSEEALTQLTRILKNYFLHLTPTTLHRIEGYDVSNTSGQLAAVSMVTFLSGKADKNEYRLFNIKTLNTPNDYQMMKEALLRRQNHPEWGKPDLIVIDGGKGQLRAALSVWTWPGIVISIAKKPDRIIFPIHNAQLSMHNKKLKLCYQVLKLSSNHPALRLVQQIRDESHRFSQFQHKRRRTKQMFK